MNLVISEPDVVEMKIFFGIFHHYWIMSWESRTISLVHFFLGLTAISRTVNRVWQHFCLAPRLLEEAALHHKKVISLLFLTFCVIKGMAFQGQAPTIVTYKHDQMKLCSERACLILAFFQFF